MSNAAVLSPCQTYRYKLTRTIPQAVRWVKPCLFIMLNPSTATDTIDDPTIRRCVGFATSWLATSLTVVNLFALRATDPIELLKHEDPIGPLNEKYVLDAIEEHKLGFVVAAWGANGVAKRQLPLQIKIMSAGAQCLSMNGNGTPGHPLYIKGDQPLRPWTSVLTR